MKANAKQTFVHADSPVDVGALIAELQSTGTKPGEQLNLGVSGGAVTFNLPAIADLPGGALNQKIAIVLLDAAASAEVQPDADDTICTLGTGIAYSMNASQKGESTIFQPVFDNVWHSGECSVGD